MDTASRSTRDNSSASDRDVRHPALLASGAGICVAALYVIQPMVPAIGAELGMTLRTMGWMPALTQLGYMLGVFFVLPLSDRFDRRQVILGKLMLLCIALSMAAMAPNSGVMLLACLVVGSTATVTQDIVPVAAVIATPERRGRDVGIVMMGLLTGVVLARVLSGAVAQAWSWRWVYGAAVPVVAAFAVVAWQRLPAIAPTTRATYGQLMGSMLALWRQHGALRLAGWSQGLISVGISAFWATLALRLAQAPFGVGTATAGAFGLVGLAGAMAATAAGRAADRSGGERVVRWAASLATVSLASMFALPALPMNAQLLLLAVAALGFDLGGQASLVAHQSIVYGLDDGARSRLNAVLYTCLFIGNIAGSLLGTLALDSHGWSGVTALATSSVAAGLALRLLCGALPAPARCFELERSMQHVEPFRRPAHRRLTG